MITAKNYAAQAERGLMRLKSETFHDVFVDKIKDAVHFAIPDGGKVFDDKLRGLQGSDIRLPYPLITVEYFVRWGGDGGALKIVTLCREQTVKEWTQRNPEQVVAASMRGASFVGPDTDYQEDALVLIITAAAKGPGQWMPIPLGVCIPVSVGRHKVHMYYFYAYPEALETNAKDSEWTSRSPIGHVSLCVAELCEALSCKNVQAMPMPHIDSKKNAMRIKQGKSPIYETKVLVIDSKHGEHDGARSESDENRSGPRQHLRRGHIRRLPPDHTTKIWVNSCVVGSSQDGRIDKSYAVL